MWTVEVLERRGPEGSPNRKFTMVANSDDGGGFVEGCTHSHATPEEADACPVARHTMSITTGMPYPAVATSADDQARIDRVMKAEAATVSSVDIGSRTLPVYFAGDAEAAIAAVEAKAAEFVALLDGLRTPLEPAQPYVEGEVIIPMAIGMVEEEINLAIQHTHEAEMWAMKLLRRRR